MTLVDSLVKRVTDCFGPWRLDYPLPSGGVSTGAGVRDASGGHSMGEARLNMKMTFLMVRPIDLWNSLPREGVGFSTSDL